MSDEEEGRNDNGALSSTGRRGLVSASANALVRRGLELVRTVGNDAEVRRLIQDAWIYWFIARRLWNEREGACSAGEIVLDEWEIEFERTSPFLTEEWASDCLTDQRSLSLAAACAINIEKFHEAFEKTVMLLSFGELPEDRCIVATSAPPPARPHAGRRLPGFTTLDFVGRSGRNGDMTIAFIGANLEWITGEIGASEIIELADAEAQQRAREWLLSNPAL